MERVVYSFRAVWCTDSWRRTRIDQPMVAGASWAPANNALHLTPENVAKIRQYNCLFRVAEHGAVGRGAQVSLNVRRLLVAPCFL